ncbi:phytanoyl-CoA dioxygenase family protein [Candidatus Methylopumilus universalis]|nr:phytanoyl-CoA dioxygenase family protein [Candidatus Methylopumilus universalis]
MTQLLRNLHSWFLSLSIVFRSVKFLYRLSMFELYKFFVGRVVVKSTHNKIILNEIRKNGFFVISSYWSEEKCTTVIKEIDMLLKTQKKYIHPASKSDLRLFGAENISSHISAFCNDKFIVDLASSFSKEGVKTAFTMAAKLPFSFENLGSGEGWHRDNHFEQFKAIIYLSDVDEDNGPFQIVRNSHRLFAKFFALYLSKSKYMNYRYSENDIKAITSSDNNIQTLLGKAGTLILVDTSAIHRGKPIKRGVRYSLTNYMFPVPRIDKALFKQFSPIIGYSEKNYEP